MQGSWPSWCELTPRLPQYWYQGILTESCSCQPCATNKSSSTPQGSLLLSTCYVGLFVPSSHPYLCGTQAQAILLTCIHGFHFQNQLGSSWILDNGLTKQQLNSQLRVSTFNCHKIHQQSKDYYAFAGILSTTVLYS